MSYLAYPSSVIAVAEKYFHTPKDKRNERKSVKKLQRHYWLLKIQNMSSCVSMKWKRKEGTGTGSRGRIKRTDECPHFVGPLNPVEINGKADADEKRQ